MSQPQCTGVDLSGAMCAKKPNAESSPLTQYGGLNRSDALCAKSYTKREPAIQFTSSYDMPQNRPA
eukprot:7360089-Prymnesium_polylepis.1